MTKTKIDRIEEKLDKLVEPKPKGKKKFKLPATAKVSKQKLKEGYATVEVINENKEISFKKVPIEDGTIKIGDTVHAVFVEDICTYKGKPFLHQPKANNFPWNPIKDSLKKNETYGQKYIVAKMKSDYIKGKKQTNWGGWIVGIIILVIVAYSLMTGGGV